MSRHCHAGCPFRRACGCPDHYEGPGGVPSRWRSHDDKGRPIVADVRHSVPVWIGGWLVHERADRGFLEQLMDAPEGSVSRRTARGSLEPVKQRDRQTARSLSSRMCAVLARGLTRHQITLLHKAYASHDWTYEQRVVVRQVLMAVGDSIPVHEDEQAAA